MQLAPTHDALRGLSPFGMLPAGARAAHVVGDDALVSAVDHTMASPRDAMVTYPCGTSLGGYDPHVGEDLAAYLRRL